MSVKSGQAHSYGYIRRDRKAERASPDRMGFGGRALIVLAVLALIVVIASAIH